MRYIVLVEPEKPENTGFIARLCSNFNFDLRIVNPQFNLSEARKTANNAQKTLREVQIFDELDRAIKDLDFVVGTKPGKGISCKKFEFRENTSIVLGRESSGLTLEELDKCDAVVHVAAEYSSLNLSHAASILMYEASEFSGENDDSQKLRVVAQKSGEKVRELVARGSPRKGELDEVLGEL